MNICLIIPFYQKGHGILSRALCSVAAQRLASDASIQIVIVDDDSPVDPKSEIEMVEGASNLAITIVKRQNGGAAAARNTGLDYIADANLIAFLDSDDVWEPFHISRALTVFRMIDCDLYFCDSRISKDETLFSFNAFPFDDTHTDLIKSPNFDDLYLFDRASALSNLARRYISHTSTIVFRATDVLRKLRFNEKLKFAGEDHSMWVQIADNAREIAFSSYVGSSRGHGVDVFRSITPSDRSLWLKRNACAAQKYIQFKRDLKLDALAQRAIDDALNHHGFEVFQTLARPSGIRLLFDPDIRQMLLDMFPFPWTHTIGHMRQWRETRRAHGKWI